MVKRAILFVSLIFVMFFVANCQTVEGVGHDIEWLGEKTAETADSAATALE